MRRSMTRSRHRASASLCACDRRARTRASRRSSSMRAASACGSGVGVKGGESGLGRELSGGAGRWTCLWLGGVLCPRGDDGDRRVDRSSASNSVAPAGQRAGAFWMRPVSAACRVLKTTILFLQAHAHAHAAYAQQHERAAFAARRASPVRDSCGEVSIFLKGRWSGSVVPSCDPPPH